MRSEGNPSKRMTDKLTGEHLIERITDKERDRARVVESVLPALHEHAIQADAERTRVAQSPKARCIKN